VAFAIGRAVGTAVTRNRLRRRLRALLASRASLPPGLYLFGASPSASELSSDELSAELDRLIVKVSAKLTPVDR
jgi:ribonuclease P protein component